MGFLDAMKGANLNFGTVDSPDFMASYITQKGDHFMITGAQSGTYEFYKEDVICFKPLSTGDNWIKWLMKFKDGKYAIITSDVTPPSQKGTGLKVAPIERFFGDLLFKESSKTVEINKKVVTAVLAEKQNVIEEVKTENIVLPVEEQDSEPATIELFEKETLLCEDLKSSVMDEKIENKQKEDLGNDISKVVKEKNIIVKPKNKENKLFNKQKSFKESIAKTNNSKESDSFDKQRKNRKIPFLIMGSCGFAVFLFLLIFFVIPLIFGGTTKDGIVYKMSFFDGVTIVDYEYSGNSSLTIPSKIRCMEVRYIDDKAFESEKHLKKVFIPSTVREIGDYAFANCSSLKTVNIENGIDNMGKYVFYNCSKLEHINFPNSLTSLGEGTFLKCSSLTSVALPNSLEKIESYTFAKCTSLENVQISSSVTDIGEYAFYNCSSLKIIIIPKRTMYIDSYAFGGCVVLKIYSEANYEPFGWSINWNTNNRPIYWAREWNYDDDGNSIPIEK